MREIKFKAYIKQDKQIINVYGICYEKHSIKVEVLKKQYRDKDNILDVNIIKNPEYFEWFEKDIECELIQYTGLKDKNGKEIYENDIVKCGNSITIVKWDYEIDQDFYWGNACGFVFNFDPSKMHYTDSVEVIGNIYENPELKQE